MTELNIIPVSSENIPLIKWTEYQTEKYNGEFPKGCNYALVCGYDNIVGLDFDSQLNHNSFLDFKYVDAVLSGLKTRIDRSPHGYHVLVVADKLPKNSSWVNGVCRIEVKSLGSLVTMPPSVKDGFEYYNLNKNPHPSKVDMRELLQHVIDLGYIGNVNSQIRTFHFDKKLSKGERNIQIFKLLGAVNRVEPKLDPSILLSLAHFVYSEYSEHGEMDEREIQEIVKSVLKNKHPRSEQVWQ